MPTPMKEAAEDGDQQPVFGKGREGDDRHGDGQQTDRHGGLDGELTAHHYPGQQQEGQIDHQ